MGERLGSISCSELNLGVAVMGGGARAAAQWQEWSQQDSHHLQRAGSNRWEDLLLGKGQVSLGVNEPDSYDVFLSVLFQEPHQAGDPASDTKPLAVPAGYVQEFNLNPGVQPAQVACSWEK